MLCRKRRGIYRLHYNKKHLNDDFLDNLLTVLSREQGQCEVFINVNLDDGLLISVLSKPLRIKGSSQIRELLKWQRLSGRMGIMMKNNGKN